MAFNSTDEVVLSSGIVVRDSRSCLCIPFRSPSEIEVLAATTPHPLVWKRRDLATRSPVDAVDNGHLRAGLELH